MDYIGLVQDMRRRTNDALLEVQGLLEYDEYDEYTVMDDMRDYDREELEAVQIFWYEFGTNTPLGEMERALKLELNALDIVLERAQRI